MSAFTTHFNFEFRTGIRNKNLLLMNYLFPLGFYLMMGFIIPTINPFFRESRFRRIALIRSDHVLVVDVIPHRGRDLETPAFNESAFVEELVVTARSLSPRPGPIVEIAELNI